MNLLLWIALLHPRQEPQRALWPAALESLERSGRLVEITAGLQERLQPPPLAPGAPPLLAFRFFEGKARHRFSQLGLVMDDAAH